MAELALAADRQRFLRQQEILELLPMHIRMKIGNHGNLAQLEGFQDLFTHLDRPGTDRDGLRERIAGYFWHHIDLRGHLSKICFPHNPHAQMQIAFLTVSL